MIAIYATGAALGALIAWWRMPTLPQVSWLLPVAAAPQLLTLFGVRHSLLVMLSLVALCLWGLHNRQLPGIALMVIGGTLNLVTMILHGGSMPIATSTLAAVHVHVPTETLLAGSKDTAFDNLAGVWLLLSDWIIVRLGVKTIIASPGDLLLVIGIVRWLTAHRKEHPS